MAFFPISALFLENQCSQVSVDSDIRYMTVPDFLQMPRSLRLPDLRKKFYSPIAVTGWISDSASTNAMHRIPRGCAALIHPTYCIWRNRGVYTMRSSLFLCVILGGVAPFFFFGGPTYHSPQSHKAAWDLGHIFFFCVVTILFFQYLIHRKRQWLDLKHLAMAFLIVLVLGISVELLQMYSSHRSPDVYDVLRNQLGCLVGYALLTLKYKGVGVMRWWLKPFHCFVCGCLLFALWPLARSLVDEQVAQKQFPVLADFETPFERLRWVNSRQLEVQGEIVRHGKRALQVQLTTATYSGTTLFYFPHNWHGYSMLHFSVYNPLEQSLELHCRIHDTKHKESGSVFSDRFHRKFIVHQGWNDLQVPLAEVEQAPQSRNMDLGHIENLGFFVVRQPESRLMYLDHIYLTR